MANSDNLAQYDDYINEAAKKYNVDPNLIRAVIKQESGGNAQATNKNSSATGLMQLTDAHGLSKEERLDPRTNILAGTAYLAANLKAFNGDVQKALLGYNQGTGGARAIIAGKKPMTNDAYNYATSPNYLPIIQASNPTGSLPQPAKPLHGKELVTAKPQTEEAATTNATQPALMGADTTAGVVAPTPDAQAPIDAAKTEAQRLKEEQEKNRKAKQDALDQQLKQQEANRQALYATATNGLIAALAANNSGKSTSESKTIFNSDYRPSWGAPTEESLNIIGSFGSRRSMLGQ